MKCEKHCGQCGNRLSELCFFRNKVECRWCGLWFAGKCPVYNRKRVHPLMDKEKAFVNRLRDFDHSEWIKASLEFDSIEMVLDHIDEEGNMF